MNRSKTLPELASPLRCAPGLEATAGRHGLDLDDGDARLPGLVLECPTDAVVEHYWDTIRRNVR